MFESSHMPGGHILYLLDGQSFSDDEGQKTTQKTTQKKQKRNVAQQSHLLHTALHGDVLVCSVCDYLPCEICFKVVRQNDGKIFS